jgi:hypothetical protein
MFVPRILIVYIILSRHVQPVIGNFEVLLKFRPHYLDVFLVLLRLDLSDLESNALLCDNF